MTHHYVGLGYGQTYSAGTLAHKPTLPMTDDDLISNLEMNLSDDPMDYEKVVAEEIANLELGDTLTIVFPNQAALWILDEWSEDFNVPHNQREEIWTTDGLLESHVYFENAEDEDWYWLVDAETDYYDDDGRPHPVYPESLEDEE